MVLVHVFKKFCVEEYVSLGVLLSGVSFVRIAVYLHPYVCTCFQITKTEGFKFKRIGVTE